MKKECNIRQFYQPVQPAVSGTVGNVTYLEVQPDKRLQDYIYCYWQLKTIRKLREPFHYRVVADGCIDIFFELEYPFNSFVMGLSNRFTEFPLGNSFNYAGIRFLPTAFSQLFRMNASELTNRFESLDCIVPQTADFISHAFERIETPGKLQAVLDHYFLSYISRTAIEPDQRIARALHAILKNRGNVHLSKELDIGLSARQLRRLFHRQVGGSPKAFSRIIRFQSILHALEHGSNATIGRCLDAGYYDQSHFIKEFGTLYGLTPSEALTRIAQPESPGLRN